MSMFRGYVPVCLLAFLILAVLVRPSFQKGCDGNITQCLGGRPLLENGCCPGLAGESCLPEIGDLCDNNLGYSCLDNESNPVTNETGQCKGRYDLTVISREQTTLTLKWRPFAPPHYEEEYALRLKSHGINEWQSMDIGFQSHYTLRDLSPATLYLIQVAIWIDARPWRLGNFSETIMVKTKDVEFCTEEVFGRLLKVGEMFEVEGEDVCTCQPNGELICVDICDQTGMPEFPEGARVESRNGSCNNSILYPVARESCLANNVTYVHGEEVEDECQICTCLDGDWECAYPNCASVQPPTLCIRLLSTGVDDNCCPTWQCDNHCVYENETYNEGQVFTNSKCSLCTCNVTEGVQCVSDCPPVEIVLPDSSCPDPHIIETGCCPTLRCIDPDMDALSFLQKVAAASYAPKALTISLEVGATPEQETPLLYEIFISNQTNPLVWESHVVELVDVKVLQDALIIKEPMDAVTRKVATIVDGRAYITFPGMQPDTKYYVSIRKIDANAEEMEDFYTVISAMIVVKTRPLKDSAHCFHNGRDVPDGALISSDCNQICHCVMGEINCKDACPDRQLVMLPSASCPNPKLEKKEGECCSQWRCYPTELGCVHANVILQPGQSVNDGCRECACLNASMKCVSLCPSEDSPPMSGCFLKNVSGLCCPQWSCPREEQSPRGVQGSVILALIGRCPDSDINLKNDLISHARDYIVNLVDCSEDDSIEVYNICHKLKIDANCFGWSSRNGNSIRSSLSDKIKSNTTNLVMTVERNLSSFYDSSIVKEIYLTSLKLQELLNTSFTLHLMDGSIMQSTETLTIQNVEYICNPGLAYINGKCVPSEVEIVNPNMIRTNLSVVKVTSRSALIQWHPLSPSLQLQLNWLMIKYRVKGSLSWSLTETFQPWVTTWMLMPLDPNTVYTVKLVTFSNQNDKWIIADLTIQTPSFSAEERPGNNLLILIIIASICVSVAMVVLSICIFRRVAHKGNNNGFVNKTYGVQLENSPDISISVTSSSNG